jgi:putative endonuclease
MYYVYVIAWKRNNKFYIGYTNNLEERIKQHKREGDLSLIYYEAFQSEKMARTRERKLKYYGSAWRALKKRITA